MYPNIEKLGLSWYAGFAVAVPLLLLNRLQLIQRLKSTGVPVERLFRFALVGAASAMVGLGTLWILTDIAGMYYLISNVIAFVLSTLYWFHLHRRWTFRDRKAKLGLLKSFPTKLATLGLNTAWLVLFTEVVGLWYMVSAALAILLSFPLSYYISTRWIWNKGEGAKRCI